MNVRDDEPNPTPSYCTYSRSTLLCILTRFPPLANPSNIFGACINSTHLLSYPSNQPLPDFILLTLTRVVPLRFDGLPLGLNTSITQDLRLPTRTSLKGHDGLLISPGNPSSLLYQIAQELDIRFTGNHIRQLYDLSFLFAVRVTGRIHELCNFFHRRLIPPRSLAAAESHRDFTRLCVSLLHRVPSAPFRHNITLLFRWLHQPHSFNYFHSHHRYSPALHSPVLIHTDTTSSFRTSSEGFHLHPLSN